MRCWRASPVEAGTLRAESGGVHADKESPRLSTGASVTSDRPSEPRGELHDTAASVYVASLNTRQADHRGSTAR